MEFSPNNPIVKLCLQGMQAEAQGDTQKATSLSLQAWNEASDDFEKFIAAFFVAGQQKNPSDELTWLQTTLQLAQKINDHAVKPAFTPLYDRIAKCYEQLNDTVNAKKNYELTNLQIELPTDPGPFYHGTKADLKTGDLLTAGYGSNYKSDLVMNHIYFTALVNGAGLAASLAKGDGPERVYIVDPTGDFENDPNVTNKKFPGNPTRSYRTTSPLKIIGEVRNWINLSSAEVEKFRQNVANSKGDIIN